MKTQNELYADTLQKLSLGLTLAAFIQDFSVGARIVLFVVALIAFVFAVRFTPADPRARP